MDKKVIKLVLTISIILGVLFLIQTYSLAATITFSNAETKWETSNYVERYKLNKNVLEELGYTMSLDFESWNNRHKKTVNLINVPDNHYLVLATKLLENEPDWNVGKNISMGKLTYENGNQVNENKFVMGAGANNSIQDDGAYEVIPNVLCSEPSNGGDGGQYYIQSILSISPYEIILDNSDGKKTVSIETCESSLRDEFSYLNELAFFLNETYTCRNYLGGLYG